MFGVSVNAKIFHVRELYLLFCFGFIKGFIVMLNFQIAGDSITIIIHKLWILNYIEGILGVKQHSTKVHHFIVV